MFASLTLSSTPNVYVEYDKVPISADCMHQDLACRGDYHARAVEGEVTLKLETYSSAVESIGQSESDTVLNAGGRSDVDTDSDNLSLSSTYTGRQLSFSETGVPQDAEINSIQSAREHQSSEINVTSATLVQTSSHRSIESRVQSSLVTIHGGQDVATCQPSQHSSAPKLDSNELAECAYQTVESGGGHHELEMGSEFKLSSTAHSHSVRIVERSTSGTVSLEVDRKMDENTDVPTMPPTTTLPPSDPGIPQDAGTHCIQSGCEHQSSGIDAASTALMQTSSHDSSLSNPGPKGPHSEPIVPQDTATPNANSTLQNE